MQARREVIGSFESIAHSTHITSRLLQIGVREDVRRDALQRGLAAGKCEPVPPNGSLPSVALAMSAAYMSGWKESLVRATGSAKQCCARTYFILDVYGSAHTMQIRL